MEKDVVHCLATAIAVCLAVLAAFLLVACESEVEEPNPLPTHHKKYLTVDEYLQRHPEQKSISQAFEQYVQAEAEPIPEKAQKAPVKIAFIYPGEQASDYWRRSLASFTARMTDLGIRHEVYEYFSKAGGRETRKQEQQLKKALEKDPGYLVFTLDVQQHRKAIERILTKKKPFIILQNITTPLTRWEGFQPFYVGFDHTIGTKMLADYFLTLPKSQTAPYGLLYFSQGYVSKMRGDTFLNLMQERKGPALAGSYYTEGQRDQAKKAAAELLAKGDLSFIYSCSTDVALGAVDAVKDAGRTRSVVLNGWGGGSAELEAIKKGDLDVTVMRMNDDNGVAMAEAIRLRLLGREQEVPTIFSGQFKLVTASTPEEEVRFLQQQAFRYSRLQQ